MSDLTLAIDICKRIERTLQNDWGGEGKGMIEKLRNTKLVVPEALHERVIRIGRIRNKIFHEAGFEVRNPAEFVKQGEQLLADLGQARRKARTKFSGILKKLATVLVVVLVAGLSLIFFTLKQRAAVDSDDEEDAPVSHSRTVDARPAPVRRAIASPPAYVDEAPEPTFKASRISDEPKAAAAIAKAVPQKTMAAKSESASTGAQARVTIEAPAGMKIRTNSVHVQKGNFGDPEVNVNVTVENVNFDTLKDVTMQAWLYDTSSGTPNAVIEPGDNGFGHDNEPWYVFLSKAIKRGESSNTTITNHNMMSKWQSDNAIALIRSGNYKIRLRVVRARDGWDKALSLTTD